MLQTERGKAVKLPIHSYGAVINAVATGQFRELFKVVTQGVLILCGLMFSTSITLDLHIFTSEMLNIWPVIVQHFVVIFKQKFYFIC